MFELIIGELVFFYLSIEYDFLLTKDLFYVFVLNFDNFGVLFFFDLGYFWVYFLILKDRYLRIFRNRE